MSTVRVMERLVFVYGSLKRGFYNHRILADAGARYDGPAVTVHPYIMAHGPAYPYVIDPATLPEGCLAAMAGHVKGELYCVDADTLADLDRLESHPSFYERKLVPVRLAYGGWLDMGPPYYRAWLYFLPGHMLDEADGEPVAPDPFGNITWTQADIESDLARMKG